MGTSDGVGDAAQFNNPAGIAVDSTGDLYVADTGNHTIRKITVAGVVSTFAGLAGSSGTNDGTGSTARFNNPDGITVDSAGNLYVADVQNHAIRKITVAGVVSTFAGLAGSSGTNDGSASNARFDHPHGVVVDSTGKLYVADTHNHTIREITSAGVVSTIAGMAGQAALLDERTTTISAARFNQPHGIAVDSTGNLYVADYGNNGIRKISAGMVSILAGGLGEYGSVDGPGYGARFRGPRGIALDSAGNLYVADFENCTIRKITAAGVVSTVAGLAGSFGIANGTGSNARFTGPAGIAVGNASNLYVADTVNAMIRKVTVAGVVNTLAGSSVRDGSTDGTGSNARFSFPYGIAVDSAGNVYVADGNNQTIRTITSAGVVNTLAGLVGNSGTNDGTGSNARFNTPRGIAVDGAGNLFVADTFNHTIRKITAAGVVSTVAGLAENGGSTDGTGGNARFNTPFGIAVDGTGDLFVADTFNHTIRKITAAGVVSTVAGLEGNSGSADGTGSNARFYQPQGIAVDGAGNLYVADSMIRKITLVGTNWVVSTLAGLIGSEVIAVDGTGDLFVADTSNHTIRKITAAGVVSTVAGLEGDSGSADGTGSNARFYQPQGIAVDGAGNLYVADTGNNTIRKGVFTAYSLASAAPYSPPPMNGQLTVTLLPPEAIGQWRFPWEFGWRSGGVTVSNLVAGNYTIEFRSVQGYVALPISPVQVTSGNTTIITNVYYPTINAGDANSTPGSLNVYLGPTPPSGAGWRFLGESGPFFTSGFTTNLLPGTYLIEFAFVTNRVKPPSQTVQISPGLPSYLSVNYLLAAAPPANVYLPFPVPANLVNDENIYPFGFNGQLQSDTGYGSGVAVQTNVVLTAAHLVFNDQTLSYVNRAHWSFRRDVGVSEPLPQAARGFYVLSGYAAQRTNDLASGYSPDQSTPPSRNADVAALYFLESVAGGGHGGYLPSDGVPNTWLTSTALKMLVGYPVDGSQFGTNIFAGKMYQTDPQPYPLSLAPDPVPGQQQVYLAPWFLSYPGASGGPLYVQLNGYYYPAAVYLGTLFSGAQPYASVVRAIDSSVVNLITVAQGDAGSGTNNTGGGVITIIPSQNISSSNSAYLQVHLAPPAAVNAGAGWRLQGSSNYANADSFIVQIISTNAVAVEFKPVPGWLPPANPPIQVYPNPTTPTVVPAFYTVTNPVLRASAQALGITGTTGTTYRIETRNSLTSGTWQPLSTNVILTNGFNLVLSNATSNGPTRFYRAVWLP